MLTLLIIANHLLPSALLLLLLTFPVNLIIPPIAGKPISIATLLANIEPKHVFCKKGETYEINSGADLRDNYEKLECIFDLGVVPSKEPVGMYNGDLLSLGSTRIFNGIGEQIWQGKMGMRTQCQDRDTEFVFIQNFIFGDLMAPAHVYIGSLKDSVRSSERDNGKDYLFIDYSANWEGLCPTAGGDTSSTPSTLNSVYPICSVANLARVVGMTNDGGQIILGKTYCRDISDFPPTGDLNIAWWFVVNYDEDSYPVSIPEPLGPAAEDFEITYKGFLDRNSTSEAELGGSRLKENPTFLQKQLIYFLTRKPLGIPISPSETEELHNFLEELPPTGVAEKFTSRGNENTQNVSGQQSNGDTQIENDYKGSEYMIDGQSITGRPGSGVTDAVSAALNNILPEFADSLQLGNLGNTIAASTVPVVSMPLRNIGDYINYLPENTVAALGTTPFGIGMAGLPDQSMDALTTVVDIENAISTVDKALLRIAYFARSRDDSSYQRDSENSSKESVEEADGGSPSHSDGQRVLAGISENLNNLRKGLQQLAAVLGQSPPAKDSNGFLK